MTTDARPSLPDDRAGRQNAHTPAGTKDPRSAAARPATASSVRTAETTLSSRTPPHAPKGQCWEWKPMRGETPWPPPDPSPMGEAVGSHHGRGTRHRACDESAVALLCDAKRPPGRACLILARTNKRVISPAGMVVAQCYAVQCRPAATAPVRVAGLSKPAGATPTTQTMPTNGLPRPMS